MSTNWINTNNSIDAVGILRKTIVPQQQQNTENRTTDLLVFGYACKIFRDDEKAINIDQGKHLIPWMGDESLKIDRYDVRATLSDLTQYEPPPGGYINRLDCLSSAEQRAEQLCEEERYYSLYHNEEEEQMYQEEELKRLHQQASSTYGQVQFDYNKEEQIVKDPLTEVENKSDEQDELYSPPAHLEIPESIETPETMKLHAIIEKTAKFISSQGPQMEILIKAKQSNNPQFEFLNVDNRLNPYYKFILAAFKNGTYPTQPEREYTQDSANDKNDHSKIEGQQNDYMNSNYSYSSMIVVPTIKYKPSANCAYTQLISKIKGVPIPLEQPDKEESSVAITPTLLSHNPPSYQDNISSIENTKTESSNSQYRSVNDAKIPKTDTDVEIKKISTGLALAQCYNSDSEEENDENSETDQSQQQQQQEIDPNIPIPPEYMQHIIDKTVAYVLKNGKQFEDILREKQDSRFLFLDPNNEYHQYYMFKVTGVVNPYPTSDCSIDTMDSDKPKVITPVSFSIKTKEDVPVSIKPALPQETSDDESESTTETATNVTNQNQSNQNATSINPVTKVVVPEHVQRAIQLVENQLMNRGAQYAAVAAAAAAAMAAANNSNIVGNKESGQKSRFDVDNTGNLILNHSPLPSVPVKIIESIQQKELKRAEEKVKDRLAQIAREKLGLISKEKQLQLERKKKAMAFLNQIKNSTSGTSSSPLAISNKDCKVTEEENDSHRNHECNGSDSGESSVHSIPISSPNNLIENENSDNNDHDDDNYKYEIDKIQDEYEKNLNSMLITEKNKNKEPSSKSDNSKKIKSHSRSRSRSKRISRSRSKSKSKRSSSVHKHKKKSSSDKHHSKKKSKRKSRSRSRSTSSTSKSNQKSMSTTMTAINSSRNSRNSSSSSSCYKKSSNENYSDYKKYDHDRNRDRGSYDRHRFKSPTPIMDHGRSRRS